jgi:hypothetical protein
LTINLSSNAVILASLVDIVPEPLDLCSTITNNTVETVRVSAAFDGSDVNNVVDISFTFTLDTIKFNGFIYKTMKSPRTGRIWLDRNLGATQTQDVNSGTNSAAYGDIYQWGRGNKDKHKSRGSGTISTRLASIYRFLILWQTESTSWHQHQHCQAHHLYAHGSQQLGF